MTAPLTQQDLAQAAKLLERLRTGELNLIPSFVAASERKEDASTAMLQRVEAFLSEGIRRMNAPIGDGGSAFSSPNIIGPNGDVIWGADGMTLRDYAAIKFAAAMLANPAHAELLHDHEHRQVIAFSEADAMLKQRSA